MQFKSVMFVTLVEELNLSADARGIVFEPLDAERLPAQRNAHVVTTEPGAVRGNHYHEHSTEVAVVMGPARVCFRENGQLQEVSVPEGHAYRFTFAPYVSHAFQNIGARAMLLVAFNTAPFNRDKPDVHRDILIESGK
jgi:dTDP-4-dehydrorhamnose 3,5-epimerase-like enzyme